MILHVDGKSTKEKSVTTATKISLFFVFIFSCINSTRAYSAVTAGSIASYITIAAEVLNPILQMFVSLSTIAVGITTIIVARNGFKKLKQEKKDD